MMAGRGRPAVIRVHSNNNNSGGGIGCCCFKCCTCLNLQFLRTEAGMLKIAEAVCLILIISYILDEALFQYFILFIETLYENQNEYRKLLKRIQFLETGKRLTLFVVKLCEGSCMNRFKL